MVKSRFERKVLVSSDEEDEEKFSADETGTNDNLDSRFRFIYHKMIYRVAHMYLNDFVSLFLGHWVT